MAALRVMPPSLQKLFRACRAPAVSVVAGVDHARCAAGWATRGHGLGLSAHRFMGAWVVLYVWENGMCCVGGLQAPRFAGVPAGLIAALSGAAPNGKCMHGSSVQLFI